jgi:uroporphyrinogen decarboxylase
VRLSGRDLIIKSFNHETVERVPWIPYTGVQVGSLTNTPANKLLMDEDLLFTSLMEAHRLYGPDGMPIVFDLQIEAEILGCELLWAEKAPPSVKTHPLANDKSIPTMLPSKHDGRLSMVLNVMERMKQVVGETTALYGLVCGPLTLASHLRGMNLFMDMYEDEKYVHDLIDFCTDVSIIVADYYINAGMDVIAAVDPMVSLISPNTFQQYLHKPFSKIFSHLRDKNTYSGFFVCGDATKNMDVMCHTQPDSISIDENIDIVKAKIITDAHNILISGNIPLTTVMMLGTQQDNQKYALDLINAIGTKNFALAPGCDMPFDVPSENIIGIAQAVHNPQVTGNFLENYEKKEQHLEVTMPDYENLDKPLIEIFTIDSATCAACGYMTQAAMEMEIFFGEQVDIVERKITEPENVAKLEIIGLKNLPSLLINGKPKFISIIPTRDELREEIQKHL